MCWMSGMPTWMSKNLIPTIQDKEAASGPEARDERPPAKALEHEFPELATTEGLDSDIKENPPLIFHFREKSHEEHFAIVQSAFAQYRETMQEDRRLLLDRFKLVDMAVKVVGVGSVGTFCGILLLMASEHDPLFLQFKQARPSVLESLCGQKLARQPRPAHRSRLAG